MVSDIIDEDEDLSEIEPDESFNRDKSTRSSGIILLFVSAFHFHDFVETDYFSFSFLYFYVLNCYCVVISIEQISFSNSNIRDFHTGYSIDSNEQDFFFSQENSLRSKPQQHLRCIVQFRCVDH